MDKDLKGELVCQDPNDKFVMDLSIFYMCYSVKMLLKYLYLQIKVTRTVFVSIESPTSVLLESHLQILLKHHHHLSHCSLKSINQK